MPTPDELLLLKRQEEEQLQHLQTLQTWEHAEGAPLLEEQQQLVANVTAFQTQYNKAYLERMRAQAPHAEAQQAAHVPHPPVQAPAAQEGYKARREREKKRKAARKLCPVGDEHTLDMSMSIQTLHQCGVLSLTPELLEQAQANHCDTRALRIFCDPFQLNRKKNPATPQDEDVLAQNRTFLQDYVSGDAQLRKPHLDRIVKDLIATTATLKPDMLSDEKITENITMYKQLGDRFTYIENIEKENPEYFENLPPLQKDLYAAQKEVYRDFTFAFAQHVTARGIDLNSGSIYGYNAAEPIALGEQFKQPATQNYQQSLQQMNHAMDEGIQREIERQQQAAYQEAMQAHAEMETVLRKESGVSFPEGATKYQYEEVEKYRHMIVENHESYAADPQLIDRVFTDLYRVFAKIGQQTVKMNSWQRVIDDNYTNSRAEVIQRRTMMAADERMTEAMEQVNTLSQYANGLTDLLYHKLRGKPLSDPAAVVLARYQAVATDHAEA